MQKIDITALDSFIGLNDQDIQNFREKGYILTKGLLNEDEATHYREVINHATFSHNMEKRSLEERDTYGKAFLQVMNLWTVDESVKRFTLAKRFAKIAEELLGVDRVRIYHDQALYKESGGGHTPWHQDQYYWPLDTLNTVTMWMPLVDITEDMGILTFASGSHKKGVIENLAISDESDEIFKNYITGEGYDISHPKFMNAGDATWHYGSTLHYAPANQSAITREVMTIIYFADGAKVTSPVNKHQENDRMTWLGGLEADSIADSSLNPIVYFD